MTYADLRAGDLAILRILREIREANIQALEYESIKKILIEGADKRYLQEVIE